MRWTRGGNKTEKGARRERVRAFGKLGLGYFKAAMCHVAQVPVHTWLSLDRPVHNMNNYHWAVGCGGGGGGGGGGAGLIFMLVFFLFKERTLHVVEHLSGVASSCFHPPRCTPTTGGRERRIKLQMRYSCNYHVVFWSSEGLHRTISNYYYSLSGGFSFVVLASCFPFCLLKRVLSLSLSLSLVLSCYWSLRSQRL